MVKIKAFIRLVFGFSQSETNAFIILLPLMMIILFSEPIYRSIALSGKPDHSNDFRVLDSLVSALTYKDSQRDTTPVFRLFHFDPNTATEEEFITLGLRAQTAKRIINYRKRGARFRTKSDLQKIYGIDSSTYASLAAYIKLPERYVYPKKDSTKRSVVQSKKAAFDLNRADSAVLKSVYGIGPVMAKRIIGYRSKLGGFVAEEQLYEVWGLDTTVARRVMDRAFIDTGFVPVKININAATEDDLAQHPYLRWKLAQAIVRWRFQHGAFENIQDIQKITSIDEKVFLKIKPYLTLE